jgi:hypothetical protein
MRGEDTQQGGGVSAESNGQGVRLDPAAGEGRTQKMPHPLAAGPRRTP